jgi:hypothetical protein
VRSHAMQRRCMLHAVRCKLHAVRCMVHVSAGVQRCHNQPEALPPCRHPAWQHAHMGLCVQAHAHACLCCAETAGSGRAMGLAQSRCTCGRVASPESGQVEVSVLQRCVRKAPIRRQSALLIGLRLSIRECRTAPPQAAVRHEPTARRRVRMRGSDVTSPTVSTIKKLRRINAVSATNRARPVHFRISLLTDRPRRRRGS